MHKVFVIIFWACVSGPPLSAHEFWIELPATTSPQGSHVRPVVHIGESLSGATHTFEPGAYVKAVWSGPDETQSFHALPQSQDLTRLKALGTGLHILAVQSYPRNHTYRSESAFLNYVRSVGLEGRVNTAQASLAADGRVRETYRRFAKTLVNLGSSKGSDRRIGLESEWVRERGGFRLYSGRRSVKNQPALLHCRSLEDSEVSTVLLETDRRGMVRPKVKNGSKCLLNSVLLRRQANGSWMSDWVSVYFRSK